MRKILRKKSGKRMGIKNNNQPLNPVKSLIRPTVRNGKKSMTLLSEKNCQKRKNFTEVNMKTPKKAQNADYTNLNEPIQDLFMLL